MEATAALGLAGNVVQFVDFSQKLCHMFLEIHNTSHGITQSNHDSQKRIETFLGSLDKVTADLNTYSQVLSGADGNIQLEGIVERCKDIAIDLLSRLKGLQVTGKMGKLKAAVAAAKSMWKEKELNELQKQLRKYREELMWILFLSMRSDLSLLESWQNDQFSELQSSVIAKLTEVIRSQLKEMPVFHIPEMKAQPTPAILHVSPSSSQADEDESTLDHDDEQLVSQPSIWDKGTAIDTSTAIAETIASRLAENDRQILESLDFLVMRDRENAISEAWTATFDWIFRDSTGSHTTWSDFSRWLAEGASPGIYWINGKAGSGKSTLMKHIFHHEKTRNALAKWANDSKMLLAGFFFSYSGVALQKSQEGLLRALLYACLKNHRELIPLVVPSPHRNNFSSDEYRDYWSLDRLETAMRRLVSQKLVALKFCFFIDGLDEYAGRYSDISSILIDVANHSHVKICASSRPLLAFERSLSVFPGLVLQHLTLPDIRRFVEEKLSTNNEMKQLEIREPGFIESLTTDITTKASGVFLWVTLVVGSLLDGSENFDDASDLKRRLDDLPPDLEDLYWHMVQRVKPQWYLEEGFRLLLLVKAAGGTVDVLTLVFAEMPTSCHFDIEEPLSMSPDVSEQQEYCRRLIGRMKTRCLGLLEVFDSAGEIVTARLTFLHKSVSDFLETDRAKETIARYLSDDHFVPDMYNLCGLLLTLKTFQTRKGDRAGLKRQEFFDKVLPLVDEIMAMARNLEYLTQAPEIEIIDELDRIISALWDRVRFKSNHEKLGLIHWTIAPQNAEDPLKTKDEDGPPNALLWADRHGCSRSLRCATEGEYLVVLHDRATPDKLAKIVDSPPFICYTREQGLYLYAAARGLGSCQTTNGTDSRSFGIRNRGIEPLRAAEEVYGTEGQRQARLNLDALSIRRYLR